MNKEGMDRLSKALGLNIVIVLLVFMEILFIYTRHSAFFIESLYAVPALNDIMFLFITLNLVIRPIILITVEGYESQVIGLLYCVLLNLLFFIGFAYFIIVKEV